MPANEVSHKATQHMGKGVSHHMHYDTCQTLGTPKRSDKEPLHMSHIPCIYSVFTKKRPPPKYNGVVFEILGRHH